MVDISEGGIEKVNEGLSGQLRILATTDLHMHLTGWNDRTGVTESGLGLARISTLIVKARQEATGGTLLLDNGDALQGTAMADVLAEKPVDADHPWVQVTSALGYDALGLGNHDFDYGKEYLSDVAEVLTCPVVASSVRSDLRGVQSSQLVECAIGHASSVPVPKVGIVSVLPEQTAIWNGKVLNGSVQFLPPVDAASSRIKHLREKGADLIVLLAHCSFVQPGSADEDINCGAWLAKLCDIDAMVGGHGHGRFPHADFAPFDGADLTAGTLHGVPAVMPGYGGNALGVIDLDLTWGEDRWRVTAASSKLIETLDVTEDPAVLRITAKARAETAARMSERVGHTAVPIHSYFSLLRADQISTLMADALEWTVREALASTKYADWPVLGTYVPNTSGGRAGPHNYVSVSPGAIRQLHLSAISPYRNHVCGIPMRGADLIEWLERSAVIYSDELSDRATLIDPNLPSFYFDFVRGLDFKIDPTQPRRYNPEGELVDPKARRIRDIQYLGQPIDPDARFVLATTSYRAAGGGNFPGTGNQERHIETNVTVQSALRTVLANAEWDAPPPPTWRLDNQSGLDVIFETSPAALDHLHEIAHLRPRYAGRTNRGFARVLLTI
ncbi:MAG: 5'-nucleotidase C-terminal domain-containing protein [Pseudomonadota bacterium]